MEYKEIKNARLSESYHVYKMDNGLTVMVYPMPTKNGIFAMLSARIGSVNRDFTLDGRRVEVPAGIAHFLEHKLFENENEDAFSLFAKTGANANAYTSFERTCYLFSATINMEQSLQTLIRFVTNPVFSKETVQKEQGIIAQEIKMYDDNAEWVLTNMMFKNMYKKHALNDDIAGTVESIAMITPELLYDCYGAFYRPSNMVLAVAGNISHETVKDICAQEYAGYKAQSGEVSEILADEPEGIVAKSSERAMSVFESMFGLSYKEKAFSGTSKLRDEMTLKLAVEMLTDETSDLFRKLYDCGLANDMFDASVLSGRDYLCVAFSGESKQPADAISEIMAEIARVKEKGFDAERFEECKRAFLGAELCSFDSMEAIAGKMTVSHFKDYDLYDIIDIIEDINLDDICDMLGRVLHEDNSAVAVIQPIDQP